MEAVRRRVPMRACEEARSLASLALDGQLDDVGARFLRRHVERCAECAGVVAEVQAVVATLRAAPLETYACPVPVRRVGGSWAT